MVNSLVAVLLETGKRRKAAKPFFKKKAGV